jgi:hypothetical protein
MQNTLLDGYLGQVTFSLFSDMTFFRNESVLIDIPIQVSFMKQHFE